MMNDELKAGPFQFIIHHSAFIFTFRRVMNYLRLSNLARPLSILSASLLLIVSGAGGGARGQNVQARTPTETVRDFYQMMRERHFKEAFALSIYKPAVDGLSAAEFEELRPDFEKMAAVVPEKIDVSGEQVSGDNATVFVKIADADKAAEAEPVTLIREGGAWIVGDRDNQAIVKKAGKQHPAHEDQRAGAGGTGRALPDGLARAPLRIKSGAFAAWTGRIDGINQ